MRSAADVELLSCSGTIVAPRAIVTASHCLEKGISLNENASMVRVWLGSGADILAQSFVAYPSGESSGFDIGVIFMTEDLPRAPAPILASRAGRRGEIAVVSGWGRDQNGVSGVLRAGFLPVFAAVGGHLETQHPGSAIAPCDGDSGGPLLLSEGGVWAIAGIVSRRTVADCNTGTHVYTAVFHTHVHDFILQHVPNVARR